MTSFRAKKAGTHSAGINNVDNMEFITAKPEVSITPIELTLASGSTAVPFSAFGGTAAAPTMQCPLSTTVAQGDIVKMTVNAILGDYHIGGTPSTTPISTSSTSGFWGGGFIPTCTGSDVSFGASNGATRSAMAYTGDFIFQCTVSGKVDEAYWSFGVFGSSDLPNYLYSDYQFGLSAMTQGWKYFYRNSSNMYVMRSNGTSQGGINIANGDILQWVRSGNNLYFKKNGTTIFSDTYTGASMYLCLSAYVPGAFIWSNVSVTTGQTYTLSNLKDSSGNAPAAVPTAAYKEKAVDTFTSGGTTSSLTLTNVTSGLLANGSVVIGDGVARTLGSVVQSGGNGSGTGQSYSNSNGTGGRTSSITVTNSSGFSGMTSSLVDGDKTTMTGSMGSTRSADPATMYFIFDFGVQRNITEAKLYKLSGYSIGSWKWQGSNTNNGSDWVDLCSTIDAGTSWPATYTLTSPGNYRYYKYVISSGSFDNGGWYEMEFKIDALNPYTYTCTSITPSLSSVPTVVSKVRNVTSISGTNALFSVGDEVWLKPAGVTTLNPFQVAGVTSVTTGGTITQNTTNICTGGTPFDSYTGHQSSCLPSYAFDGDTASANLWFAAGSPATPGWGIGYDLGAGNAKCVWKYRWYAYNAYSPTNWYFQGSNDNATWTTLDTRLSQSMTTEVWNEYVVTGNYQKFRYYRVYWDGTNPVQVGTREIQMYDQSYTTPVTTNTYTFAGTNQILPERLFKVRNSQAVFGQATSGAYVAQATGTAFGNMTGLGGLAAAFDGNESQASTSSAVFYNSYGNDNAYIGKTYSSGKVITGFYIVAPTNIPFYNTTAGSNIRVELYGKNSVPANATDGTLLGALDYFLPQSGQTFTFTNSTNSTPYTNVWIRFMGGKNDLTAWGVAEVKFFEGVISSTPTSWVLTHAQAALLATGSVVYADGVKQTVGTVVQVPVAGTTIPLSTNWAGSTGLVALGAGYVSWNGTQGYINLSQTLSGNFTLTMTVDSIHNGGYTPYIGLVPASGYVPGTSGINNGYHFAGNGTTGVEFNILKNGTQVVADASYTVSKVLQIVRSGTTLTITYNGVTLYTDNSCITSDLLFWMGINTTGAGNPALSSISYSTTSYTYTCTMPSVAVPAVVSKLPIPFSLAAGASGENLSAQTALGLVTTTPYEFTPIGGTTLAPTCVGGCSGLISVGTKLVFKNGTTFQRYNVGSVTPTGGGTGATTQNTAGLHGSANNVNQFHASKLALPVNATIISVRTMNSWASGTITCGIAKKVDTGNYIPVAAVDITVPNTSTWTDGTFGTPFVIPNDGYSYVLFCWGSIATGYANVNAAWGQMSCTTTTKPTVSTLLGGVTNDDSASYSSIMGYTTGNLYTYALGSLTNVNGGAAPTQLPSNIYLGDMTTQDHIITNQATSLLTSMQATDLNKGLLVNIGGSDVAVNWSGTITEVANTGPVGLIPTMTSNNSAGCIASGTSESYPAYQAFNGNPVDSWAGSQVGNQSLQINMGSQKTFTSYSLSDQTVGGPYSPSAWIFYGSNDGSNWTTIDTRSGIVWQSGETKNWTTGSQTWQYLKWTFSASLNGAYYYVGTAQIWNTGTLSYMTTIPLSTAQSAAPTAAKLASKYATPIDIASAALGSNSFGLDSYIVPNATGWYWTYFTGGFSSRMVIPANTFTSANGNIKRIKFAVKSYNGAFPITACYVGQGATAGTYPSDFASTPVQVTWNGGSTSIALTPLTVTWCDLANVDLDPTKPIIVSWYSTGGDSSNMIYVGGSNGIPCTQYGYMAGTNYASQTSQSGFTIGLNHNLFGIQVEFACPLVVATAPVTTLNDTATQKRLALQLQMAEDDVFRFQDAKIYTQEK